MFLLRAINNYSIDVALGAMVSTWYFGYVLNAQLSLWTVLTLGLTVWGIYTFDHLIDARSLVPDKVSKRHLLHRKYKYRLSVILIAVLVCLSLLIFLIPAKTVVWGVSLLGGVFVYFVAMSLLKLKFGYYKEVLIAVIYTLGVLVGPASLAIGINGVHVLIIISFALLAFLNLIVFSWYDRFIDKTQQFASIVNSIGESKSLLLLKAGFLVVFGLCGSIYLSGYSEHAFVLALMATLLGLTIVKRAKFQENQVYRIIGDSIFLLPALLLL